VGEQPPPQLASLHITPPLNLFASFSQALYIPLSLHSPSFFLHFVTFASIVAAIGLVRCDIPQGGGSETESQPKLNFCTWNVMRMSAIFFR